MQRLRIAGFLVLLLGSMASTPSLAEVVIYRCTDASGAVTLQNGTPCPKGSKQQKKVMETPPPAPPPTPMPPAAIAPSVVPESAPAPVVAPAIVEPSPPPPAVAVPRTPPPALFECRTWNRDRYFSEDAHPPPRCAPLQVTGLDGTGAMAGGTACQMMDDQCQPIPDAALCDAWKQRVRELDATAVFATGATITPAEGERIRRVVTDSTCTP